MLVALGLLAGCETPEAPVYEEANWKGTVDPNLSQEDQDKQDALIRLFTAVQQVGFANISDEEEDLQLTESFESFYGEAADLYRWDWDGPPDGNDFPVRFVMRIDEPGLPQVESRRIYSVRRSGNMFVIGRKP